MQEDSDLAVLEPYEREIRPSRWNYLWPVFGGPIGSFIGWNLVKERDPKMGRRMWGIGLIPVAFLIALVITAAMAVNQLDNQPGSLGDPFPVSPMDSTGAIPSDSDVYAHGQDGYNTGDDLGPTQAMGEPKTVRVIVGGGGSTISIAMGELTVEKDVTGDYNRHAGSGNMIYTAYIWATNIGDSHAYFPAGEARLVMKLGHYKRVTGLDCDWQTVEVDGTSYCMVGDVPSEATSYSTDQLSVNQTASFPIVGELPEGLTIKDFKILYGRTAIKDGPVILEPPSN